MSAKAVLNLGNVDQPGHADDTATLTLKLTAAYSALRGIATGNPVAQKQAAEFIEDWADCIACFSSHGSHIDSSKAVDAVRKITIEGLRRVQAEETSLSVSKGVFEQVAAKDTDNLPVRIDFTTAEPYVGLRERTFSVRLGIVTGDKPALTLRIVKAEKHDEQMARELAELVTVAIAGAMPVHIGTYKAAA